MTRRKFVAASLTAAARLRAATADAERYRTPYKYGKLVLEASPEADAFDSRSVDCPFVFHHDGRFYMTYVGWDGTGYQTGLASSGEPSIPPGPVTSVNCRRSMMRQSVPSHSARTPISPTLLGGAPAFRSSSAWPLTLPSPLFAMTYRPCPV